MKCITIVGGGATGNILASLLSKYDTSVIDRDTIEEKNIGRQILFTKQDIGKPKAHVLQEKLKIKGVCADLDYENIDLLKSDLVIDCTDNMETRFLINEYCKKNNIPWIYTGVIRDIGRVMPITTNYCFNCIFKEVKGLETCETSGVNLGIVHMTTGLAFQIAEKILQGNKEEGLYTLDLNKIEKINVNNNPNCKVCNGEYDYLKGKKDKIIKFCGSRNYQFKGDFDFHVLRRRLNEKDLGGFFQHENITVFHNRVLIKAESEEQAKKIFTEIIGN